jgi:inner membrane protein
VDNLTHTIIGLIAGESLAAAAPRVATSAHDFSARARRGLYLCIGAIGGNLPDADLLLSVGGREHVKLRYLLMHRGYTHTLLGCVLLAALLYAGVEAFLRWRHLRPVCRQRAALAGVCLFAVFLHLGMDALNSYGVHPFWPWDAGWRYGDSLFIVEPLYWAAAAPLWFVFRSGVARTCIALLLISAVAVSAASGLVLGPSLAMLIGVMGALAALASRLPPRAATWLSATACLTVTLVFMGAGRLAAQRAAAAADGTAVVTAAVATAAAATLPGAWQLLDHVLTPAPVNPLCWDVLLLQADAQHYSLRRARLSLAPGLLDATRCPDLGRGATTTVPQSSVRVASTPAVAWMGEFVMSRAEFSSVVAQHCEARALLRFSRAPFVVMRRGAWIIGDARYDREAGLGFAEIALASPAAEAASNPAACPVAPWIAPRGDLLMH